jgi:hypothetical protein
VATLCVLQAADLCAQHPTSGYAGIPQSELDKRGDRSIDCKSDEEVFSLTISHTVLRYMTFTRCLAS